MQVFEFSKIEKNTQKFQYKNQHQSLVCGLTYGYIEISKPGLLGIIGSFVYQ